MAVNKGLRRLVPSRPGINMPDSIPGCRTAFRSNAKTVRHHPGTASVIPPEYCPPWVRNAVRHGPERARIGGPDLSAFLHQNAEHILDWFHIWKTHAMQHPKTLDALQYWGH